MLLPLLLACADPAGKDSGDSGDGGDSGDSAADSGAPTCVDGAPTTPEEFAGPCGGPLCVAATVAGTLAPADVLPCSTSLGQACAGQDDQGSYSWRASGDGIEVELLVLPGFATDVTLAGLLDAFGRLTVRRLPVGDPVADGVTAWLTATWDSPAALVDPTFDGERLTTSVTWAATAATADYADIEADGYCHRPPPEDDIVLDCTCAYDGFTTTATLTLDLRLARPDGG